jgi:hypothetical protein
VETRIDIREVWKNVERNKDMVIIFETVREKTRKRMGKFKVWNKNRPINEMEIIVGIDNNK